MRERRTANGAKDPLRYDCVFEPRLAGQLLFALLDIIVKGLVFNRPRWIDDLDAFNPKPSIRLNAGHASFADFSELLLYGVLENGLEFQAMNNHYATGVGKFELPGVSGDLSEAQATVCDEAALAAEKREDASCRALAETVTTGVASCWAFSSVDHWIPFSSLRVQVLGLPEMKVSKVPPIGHNRAAGSFCLDE
jgi:hypothetical protein